MRRSWEYMGTQLSSQFCCKPKIPLKKKKKPLFKKISIKHSKGFALRQRFHINKLYKAKKTLMLGGTEGRRRRGREDEMAGWHH